MARTMARNTKGRFVKQSKSTRALVRRSPTTIVRTRTRVVKVASRRRRGSSGSSGRGTGVVARLKGLAPQLAASAGYAFVTRGKSSTATSLNTYVKKIPIISAIGAPATHGILALLIAANTGGTFRKIADYTAVAALHQAAANLGSSSFDYTAAAKLSGSDDDFAMGTMDGDDEIGADDDADIVGDDDGEP